MSESLKRTIITVSICLVLVVGLGLGFFFMSEDTQPKEEETVPESITEQEQKPVPVNKPEKIYGVWLSQKDLPQFSSLTVDEAQKELEKITAAITDKGLNTVFLDLFTDKNEFECKDGKFDAVKIIAEALFKNNIYSCAVFDSENEVDFKKAADEYNISAVVLAGDKDKIAANTEALAAFRNEYPEVEIAANASSATAKEIAQKLELKNEDFLINIPFTIEEGVKNYIQEINNLNTLSNEIGVKIVEGIRLDLIKKSFKEANKVSSVIVEQLSYLDKTENFLGTTIFSYTELMSGDDISANILKYINDKTSYARNKEFELKNFIGTKKTTDESKFTFTGTSSPLYDLTLNSKKVQREDNGDFSVEVELEKGENTFKFIHKDKIYTYKVIYTADVIKSVTPSGSINVPGKTTLTIKAIILKGSSAYATLNGQNITMKRVSDVLPSEGGNIVDESSDFAVYVGKYTVPAGTSQVQSLGRIKVYASYNGISESLLGAKVSISAEVKKPAPEAGQGGGTEIKPEPNDPTVPFEPQEMLTPYKYAGVAGKSKMCEILSICETMPANVVDDCVPYSSPLPKGTFDYVLSEFEFDGIKFLKLASGKNIKAEKAKIIPSGYNLPNNMLKVVSSTSNNKDTSIKFGLSWKVPFNIAVKNQSYIPQSQAHGGSLHSIESFNAKYIDITFYHTANVSGKVNVEGSKIVSSAQWTSNEKDSTVNLRLTLKTPGRFYGYSVKYTNDGCLTLSIKAKPASSLSSSVIMLDPGHGGKDSGAVCAYSPESGKQYEKQLNLLIANKVKAKLEAQGATVIMTRVSDGTYLSLDERNVVARQKNPDMYISLHCDSSTSKTPMGTTAFYYQAYSQPLAKSIHKRIVSTYKNSIYAGASSDVVKRIDRGTNMYPFRVTRIEECPAILIEYGFVSNISECKLLWNNSVQDKLAQATVDGIKDYIANY